MNTGGTEIDWLSPEEYAELQIEWLEQRISQLEALENHTDAEGYDIQRYNV